MKIIGIIPARYGSSRLPGKPLIDICGKPMVCWVYNQALKASKLDEVYIATDDLRIKDVCQKYDLNVIMTSPDCRTAANRMYEVSNKILADFYVTINGDEPLIDPDVISAVVPNKIITDIEYGTNIITKINKPAEVNDLSNIKVVFTEDMHALYMSRTPIPTPYSSIEYDYYKHVGVIGYNKKMLEFYNTSEPGNFEKIEGIDTLRFLDYGKTLEFIKVKNSNSLSVDTVKDLEEVRLMMSQENKHE